MQILISDVKSGTMTRTKQQHRVLFALLARLGLTATRAKLAEQYSDGRTSKTSKLTVSECQLLIDDLQGQVPSPKTGKQVSPVVLKKRRIAFALFGKLGWTVNAGEKLDYTRVNNWMLTHSHAKKELNKYSSKELGKLIGQLENMLKHQNKK